MSAWNTCLDLMCGLAAGWAQILTGQPLDFIKTKYQLNKTSKLGFVEFSKEILREHGPLGFYRGASSLFYGFAFTIALEFAIYQKCKNQLMRYHKATHLVAEDFLSLWEIGLSGAIVGFAVSYVYCPIEYAKITRQANPHIKDGSFRILMKQITQGHFRKIFRGIGLTIGRETFGSAVYYSSYERTVRALCKMRGLQRRFAQYSDFLMGGSVAGLTYWAVSYPWDVVKTQIQAGGHMAQVMSNLKSMAYRGFGTVAIRSIIVNAFSFATFEQTKALAGLFKTMTEL